MSTHINETCLKKVSILDLFALTGTSIILGTAFYYQFFLHELPCPLCLLQRIGIIIIGLGFLPNITSATESKNYSIAIFGCIITGAVATRQILLHILPGDIGFGSTFLGIHFYTWSLIASVFFLAYIAAAIFLNDCELFLLPADSIQIAQKIIITAFIAMIAINILSTFLECGLGQCADNPIAYKLLGNI